MLFMVWSDTGDCIQAYLVPDSYSTQSSMDVIVDGNVLQTLAPNAHNEHVGARHQTGQVGFVIDEAIIPGLAHLRDLELRDSESGILVYRRTSEPKIQQRLFRLETHLFPLWRLDVVLQPHFTYWYDRIDRYSAETARNILSFHIFGSIYSSGRVLFHSFEHYIRNNHKLSILMQDPYFELAERLLIFKRLGHDAKRLLNDRDAMIFAPIIEVASQLETFEVKDLRRALDKVDVRTLSSLADPVTRLLLCDTPDAPAPKGAVTRALKTLSEFDVVGLRSHDGAFSAAVAELVGMPSLTFPPLHQLPRVRTVARNLRTLRWVEGLIEHDLELYQHVLSAFEKASPETIARRPE